MKIAKALKLKNKLAGEVADLKKRLLEQNVHTKNQPFDYDSREVISELRARMKELVDVKTAIAVANTEIYERVFTLAEMKGLLVTLKSMETKHGLVVENQTYGDPTQTEYVAQIRQAEVDQMTAELNSEMQEIQDELDEFNHSRSVSV